MLLRDLSQQPEQVWTPKIVNRKGFIAVLRKRSFVGPMCPPAYSTKINEYSVKKLLNEQGQKPIINNKPNR